MKEGAAHLDGMRRRQAMNKPDAFGLTSWCLRSDAVRRQDNIPWQQRFDLGLGCCFRQLGEDVAQIGVGLEIVGLGGFDQAVEAR